MYLKIKLIYKIQTWERVYLAMNAHRRWSFDLLGLLWCRVKALWNSAYENVISWNSFFATCPRLSSILTAFSVGRAARAAGSIFQGFCKSNLISIRFLIFHHRNILTYLDEEFGGHLLRQLYFWQVFPSRLEKAESVSKTKTNLRNGRECEHVHRAILYGDIVQSNPQCRLL